MPWSKATGRSAASIALGLAGLLLVSGCADSGDARILRLEASADSTILKMSVAACVDRYAVETAQDTSEIRVRVTAYPEGDARGSCGIGSWCNCASRWERARSSTHRPGTRSSRRPPRPPPRLGDFRTTQRGGDPGWDHRRARIGRRSGHLEGAHRHCRRGRCWSRSRSRPWGRSRGRCR